MNQPNRNDTAPDNGEALERRRLRAFAYHLAGYFIVMMTVVPVNLFWAPEKPWFVLPMVGWGSLLAVHAALVMGLFDIFRRRDG